MSLREQLYEKAGETITERIGSASNTASAAYQQLKMEIHEAIIERVELEIGRAHV